jgi:hypothetical protein
LPRAMADDESAAWRRVDWERLFLAMALGEMARLRWRAECLLSRDREIPLTNFQRAELDRIAVAPTEDDRAFLDGFDRFLKD